MNTEFEGNNYKYIIPKRVGTPNNRTLLIGTFWFLLVGFLLLFILLPNTKHEKPYSNMGLVVNGSIINTQKSPMLMKDDPMVSFKDIKKYVDKNIFFDKNTQKLIITTTNNVIRFKINENIGTLNNKPMLIKTKVQLLNGVVYIPIKDFEKIYNISVTYNKANNVVIIDNADIVTRTAISLKNGAKVKSEMNEKSKAVGKINKGEQIEIAEKNGAWVKIRLQNGVEGFIENKYISEDDICIEKGTVEQDKVVVRKLPSIKQPIYEDTKKNEKINIFTEVSGWYKVRTENGVVGFIKETELQKIEKIAHIVKSTPHLTAWKPANGKINLVWEQIENVTPAMNNIDKAEGLDIVCPTWFEVTNKNGAIKSKVDAQYIRWARANGYKIWAMVSNGVSSDRTAMTSDFLNNSDARENGINKLLNNIQMNGLDGINIDFEYIPVSDKDKLVQFVRELAPIFREKGLVVSVDVNVKAESPTSLCFDRKGLAESSDYVIAMTYDQYWSTSPVSGSVAQYDWVDVNILSLLKEIPKEKFIMGVPFYTRQWKEVAGSAPVSTAISMASANNLIRQNGAKAVWDDKSGQYYAEFNKNNSKIRIWLEDAKSINLKTSLALKYDLAGVASWRRGYETFDIWKVLNNNLKVMKTYDEWKKAQAK